MTLDEFIVVHADAILASWEEHADSLLPAARAMNQLALRDHAPGILKAIVADMRTAQSREAQYRKSIGTGPRLSAERTAAEAHAVLRAQVGFSIEQLVAEYRALRASVLRKFADASSVGKDTLEEIGRFNEAVDQAIAESVRFFAMESERWRNLFLGVLGHDLRGPLNSILLSAELVSRLTNEEPVRKTTQGVLNSGERMRELLDDLLDYSRTSLGMGIPVHLEKVDLSAVCKEELSQLAAGLPDCTLRYDGPESLLGRVDASRIRQVLSNLVINASKYGDISQPITVRLRQVASEALLEVENSGQDISEATRARMFDLAQRGEHSDSDESRTSLGLGLFIVKEIARGHGGSATCGHRDGQTVFSIRLPQST
jgi:signal transduction histidine kinase